MKIIFNVGEEKNKNDAPVNYTVTGLPFGLILCYNYCLLNFENTGMKQNKDEKFITILAYVMMVFCGYLTLVSLVLSILFLFKPPLELLQPVDAYTGILRLLPAGIISLLKDHYLKISFGYLIISAVTLAASFASLKRRHWGRVYLAVFFILTMLLSVVGVFFPEHYILPVPAEENLRTVVETMNKASAFLVKILAGVIVGLHSWLAYKLFSVKIKKQFQ